MRTALSKKDLYESVKDLVEKEDIPHIHLCQHKLFTLFSIAFQYLLYKSTKQQGAYIIRIEDSQLADKLCRKAKDISSKRFLQSLLLPRKLKYNRSFFYLDFFHLGSWNLTNKIPKEKIQGALIIKNSSKKPMHTIEPEEDEAPIAPAIPELPKNYFYSSLTNFVPKTIIISYEEDFEDTQKVEFSFIKKKEEKPLSGVKISSDIDLDKLDS